MNSSVPLVPKLHLGTPLVSREIPFRASQTLFIASRSAMELPQQVRSQVQLGNEGKAIFLSFAFLVFGFTSLCAQPATPAQPADPSQPRPALPVVPDSVTPPAPSTNSAPVP